MLYPEETMCVSPKTEDFWTWECWCGRGGSCVPAGSSTELLTFCVPCFCPVPSLPRTSQPHADTALVYFSKEPVLWIVRGQILTESLGEKKKSWPHPDPAHQTTKTIFSFLFLIHFCSYILSDFSLWEDLPSISLRCQPSAFLADLGEVDLHRALFPGPPWSVADDLHTCRTL